jgi:hypothetical protein
MFTKIFTKIRIIFDKITPNMRNEIRKVIGVFFFFIVIITILILTHQIIEHNWFECYSNQPDFWCSKSFQDFFRIFFTRKYIFHTLVVFGIIVYIYSLIDKKFSETLKHPAARTIIVISIFVGITGYYIVKFFLLLAKKNEILSILIFFFLPQLFLALIMCLKSATKAYLEILFIKAELDILDTEEGAVFKNSLKYLFKYYIPYISFAILISVLIIAFMFNKYNISFSLENSHHLIKAFFLNFALMYISYLIADSLVFKKIIIYKLIHFHNFLIPGNYHDIQLTSPFEGYIDIKTFTLYVPKISYYFKLQNPRGITVNIYKDKLESNSPEILHKIETMRANMQQLKTLKIKDKSLYAEISYLNIKSKNNKEPADGDINLISSLIMSYYYMLIQIAHFIDESNMENTTKRFEI